jgi:hypothetical protein
MVGVPRLQPTTRRLPSPAVDETPPSHHRQDVWLKTDHSTSRVVSWLDARSSGAGLDGERSIEGAGRVAGTEARYDALIAV